MKNDKIKMGILLVTLGIVYGDIGTSPLYVMNSLLGINDYQVTEEYVLGVLSLVFWTITLVTTIKYVFFVLRADNHGEGGIFSLYTLVQHRKKWLIIPAMIGGAALLADSIITPALTITSAIEGLSMVPNQDWAFVENTHAIMLIVMFIITIMFLIQRNGTSIIGKFFGPVMFVWFAFLGFIGLINLIGHFAIFKALNPMYAINLLIGDYQVPALIILGSVFLATTGAEALYSDIGHVGKKNIYITWPFVKCMLLLNYFGQGAWILTHPEEVATGVNPFFAAVPETMVFFAVILSTIAAIIASQALITGAFTLVSEGIALKLLPRLKTLYPSESKGQVYLPFVSFLLWAGCMLVVLLFQTSTNMEAAYGLAITVTMLMTTILLNEYLMSITYNKFIRIPLIISFFAIEITFFIAATTKIFHGGFFTVFLTCVFVFIMFIWYRDRIIKQKYIDHKPINDYTDRFEKLSKDFNYYKVATNLVYLNFNKIENKNDVDIEILYSVFETRPKRAELYWVVSIEVEDKPYGIDYQYQIHGNSIVCVQLYFGFRERQSIPRIMESITRDLINKQLIPRQELKYGIDNNACFGDYKYIAIKEIVNNDAVIKKSEYFILNTKVFIQQYINDLVEWYDLKYSNYEVEEVPINLPMREIAVNLREEGEE